jgi:hypothetical protein
LSISLPTIFPPKDLPGKEQGKVNHWILLMNHVKEFGQKKICSHNIHTISKGSFVIFWGVHSLRENFYI